MTTWHVLLGDGNVSGPYTECQIRNGIQLGKIDDPMRVRQGQSPWIRVSKVKAIFESLDSQGFFIRDEEQAIYGPFTESRLEAMKLGNNLPLTYWIRKGKNGPWDYVDRQMHTNECTQTVSESPTIGSNPAIVVMANPVVVDETSTMVITADSGMLEPKAVVPAAPVMKLRTHTWKNAIVGLSQRFENLILGDPLTN